MRHYDPGRIHVTGLAEGLAGQTILWPAEGLPAYLLTVGAVLCAGRVPAERIERSLVELFRAREHG